MLVAIVKSPLVPAVLVVTLFYRLFDRGLGEGGVVALLGGLGWLATSLTFWLLRLRERRFPPGRRATRRETAPASSGKDAEGEAPPDRPFLSMVYLLSEPRFPNVDQVRSCVEAAFDIRIRDGKTEPAKAVWTVDATPDDEGDGAPDRIRQFIARTPHGVFGIFVSPNPYVDDPVNFARKVIRDKRLRTAVENHQAWISVDLMGDSPPLESPERRRKYEPIGKIMSAIAGPDCLAIYCPEYRRCNEFDFSLLDRLREKDPLALFSSPTFEPVIEIEEDDLRMKSAVEEAVSRWPEFSNAFLRREDEGDDRFIVKAQFSEADRSEFMWVKVTAIEPKTIAGILMNDPHELQTYHRGMAVEIPMDRLNDWMFPGEDGEPVGGFTLGVLSGEEDEPGDRFDETTDR